MGKLVDEVREWNTPIVGAYLLWRFTQSYVNNHPSGDAPVVVLHFIANTLLLGIEYNSLISGRRQNLASYIRAFSDHDIKKSDLLACLSQRICKQRSSCMNSIDIAVASGLLAWEAETAKLHPLTSLSPVRGSGSKGTSIQMAGSKAEILGKWFSNVDVNTITASLGVIL